MISKKKNTRNISSASQQTARRLKKKTTRKRQKRRFRKGSVVKGAESSLKAFRQASLLAVATTGFILLLFNADDTLSSEDMTRDFQPETIITRQQNDTIAVVQGTEQAAGEALTALQNIWNNFIFNYPKILIAVGILIVAWLVVKLTRFILHHTFRRAKNRAGVITLTTIAIWLISIGIAFSVVIGDIRALVGSFGLIGLALSWALQTPIESFTGWLLNAFRRYYKVGDRILVGDVFGDVYRIDFLSTTVWEIGSPYQAGYVNAEQPTGRLVTFPNNEILTGTVINLTGDFPFVWDELDVMVANESDIPQTMKILKKVADEVLGEYMENPVKVYSGIIKEAGFPYSIPAGPEIFLSAGDSWTVVIIRYLVGARERRKWKSKLLLKINNEINKTIYKGIIIPVYPRQQIQVIDSKGKPVDLPNQNEAPQDGNL